MNVMIRRSLWEPAGSTVVVHPRERREPTYCRRGSSCRPIVPADGAAAAERGRPDALPGRGELESRRAVKDRPCGRALQCIFSCHSHPSKRRAVTKSGRRFHVRPSLLPAVSVDPAGITRTALANPIAKTIAESSKCSVRRIFRIKGATCAISVGSRCGPKPGRAFDTRAAVSVARLRPRSQV